ncbi:unnamed protein product [Vitrella brassicaformis CCMP3155]|uniref:F-box domain-containing protein n=1 Tax=Vitrella brassicaformis (strain CCMP3155) TaxID=1169540 RepID=A0A0G4EQS7_VITBC|nr:unnamed protein product [Vitrella brassicaformis CCMP3155]|eukprot:CEM00583.1 unnamed protein product [Vitrella brassicaformis CCMP3155]
MLFMEVLGLLSFVECVRLAELCRTVHAALCDFIEVVRSSTCSALPALSDQRTVQHIVILLPPTSLATSEYLSEEGRLGDALRERLTRTVKTVTITQPMEVKPPAPWSRHLLALPRPLESTSFEHVKSIRTNTADGFVFLHRQCFEFPALESHSGSLMPHDALLDIDKEFDRDEAIGGPEDACDRCEDYFDLSLLDAVVSGMVTRCPTLTHVDVWPIHARMDRTIEAIGGLLQVEHLGHLLLFDTLDGPRNRSVLKALRSISGLAPLPAGKKRILRLWCSLSTTPSQPAVFLPLRDDDGDSLTPDTLQLVLDVEERGWCVAFDGGRSELCCAHVLHHHLPFFDDFAHFDDFEPPRPTAELQQRIVSCVQRHAAASQVVQVKYLSDGTPISDAFRPLRFDSARVLVAGHGALTMRAADDKRFRAIPNWLGEDGALAGVCQLRLDRVGVTGGPSPSYHCRPLVGRATAFARRPNNLSRLLQRLTLGRAPQTSFSSVKMQYVTGEMVAECLSYLPANTRIDHLEIKGCMETDELSKSDSGCPNPAAERVLTFAPAHLTRHYPPVKTISIDLRHQPFDDDDEEWFGVDDLEEVSPAVLSRVYRLLHECRPVEGTVKGVLMKAAWFDQPWDEEWLKTQIVLMYRHPNHGRFYHCEATQLEVLHQPKISVFHYDYPLWGEEAREDLRQHPSDHMVKFDLVVRRSSGRSSELTQPPITDFML